MSAKILNFSYTKERDNVNEDGYLIREHDEKFNRLMSMGYYAALKHDKKLSEEEKTAFNWAYDYQQKRIERYKLSLPKKESLELNVSDGEISQRKQIESLIAQNLVLQNALLSLASGPGIDDLSKAKIQSVLKKVLKIAEINKDETETLHLSLIA